MTLLRVFALFLLVLLAGCGSKAPDSGDTNTSVASGDSLESIAYDAFIYAYPMMEQVKTINGMFEFMDMRPNEVSMNSRLPMDNVGMPIVAPNLTSMTGGVFLDFSAGPVTVEIPEVKDRYIVYQAIDVFTHNFYYMGTRGNQGEGGRFVFYREGQELPDSDATPVLVEGDHAIIVIRIDIKDETEYERVREIQNAIKIVDAPESARDYPRYDESKAYSPDFVDYLNELLIEVPDSEIELFKRFAAIGVNAEVEFSTDQRRAVQANIDAAYSDIQSAVAKLEVGNGYFGATEVFGTREFLDGNYLNRAAGAHFGLWGNSLAEANYYMVIVEGEGQITFAPDQMPPLSEIGFWSVTAHDENVHVNRNPYDSGYVLTQNNMVFEEDGSLIVRFSSSPDGENWLYTKGGPMVILIRAYQADPERISSYVPPEFQPDSK